MLGIPPTILGAVLMPIYLLLVSIPIFLLALSLFVGGYVLQFVGHAIDRSEPGEVTFLRRWATRKLASLQEKPTLATRSQP